MLELLRKKIYMHLECRFSFTCFKLKSRYCQIKDLVFYFLKVISKTLKPKSQTVYQVN